MALYTLVQASAKLAEYLAAESAILKGQSYSIGDRSLERADLREIVKQRKYWAVEVSNLSSGRTGPRPRRVIPRDK